MPYLAHLRRERIPYLITGTSGVGLTSALAKMRTLLGVRCLVSQAGGGLNGALLRAGLVDELHIVTVPVLVAASARRRSWMVRRSDRDRPPCRCSEPGEPRPCLCFGSPENVEAIQAGFLGIEGEDP